MNIQRRAQWIATVMLLLTAMGLVGLLVRVVWIQRHINDETIRKISAQNTATEKIMRDRGDIKLSDGTTAACSVRVYNLYADPAYIVDPDNKLNALHGEDIQKARDLLAAALAPLLKKDPGNVIQELESNVTYPSGRPRRFLWLAREVDADFKAKFDELRADLHKQAAAALKDYRKIKDPHEREQEKEKAGVLAHALDGVNFVESIKRVYPLKSLAGQILGIANNYGGVDGAEIQFNDLLQARAGQISSLKDATRHTLLINQRGYNDGENGCDVWLTMDTVIQSIAEEELANAGEHFKAESGVAVVMDPYSGRILAMATWPPYDPGQYQQTKPELRRNRAFDPYEPGSIFKTVVAAWAIEKGVVTPATVFDCHMGHWTDPTGRAVTDHGGYGAMSVEDILVKSSNIGMAQVGWRMGIPMLYEAVSTFGFGARTGVELPGDEKGIVPALAQWNKGTLTSASFGYAVAATPLQLVRGFCTFANGGYLVTPRAIQAVELSPGNVVPWDREAGPALAKQIISAKTCTTMRNILEGVYERGTAKSARSKLYRLYGKTGTAHLAIQGAGHYAGDQYNGSFLAAGPMTQPRLAVIVTLHKPDRSLGHFGGTVAAPAATQILERALLYLQVPPDQTETGKDLIAGRN